MNTTRYEQRIGEHMSKRIVTTALVPTSEHPDSFDFADTVSCTVCGKPIGWADDPERGMVQGDMYWEPVCSDVCTEAYYADAPEQVAPAGFTLAITLPSTATPAQRKAYGLLVEQVISTVEVASYDLEYPRTLVQYINIEGDSA